METRSLDSMLVGLIQEDGNRTRIVLLSQEVHLGSLSIQVGLPVKMHPQMSS